MTNEIIMAISLILSGLLGIIGYSLGKNDGYHTGYSVGQRVIEREAQDALRRIRRARESLQTICPICGGDMHEYFMGDDVRRYRCMACETKVEVGR